MRRRPRSLYLSLALLALVLLVATPAFAADPPAAARPGVVPLGAATAPWDEWDTADDVPLGAQNLDAPGKLQPLGGEPVWQEHAFYQATGTNGDSDWYKFYVTPADIAANTCFRIEARVETNQVDPCVEVYGPVPHGAAPGFAYTDPPDMSSGFLYYWTLDSTFLFGIPDCKAGSDDLITGKDCRTASVVFTPGLDGLASGDYYIRVRPKCFFHLDGTPIPVYVGSYSDKAGDYVFTMQRGGFERIAGEHRADTAFLIATRSYNIYGPKGASTPDANTSGNVVIANGWKFPDALAGSALCGALQAPLLLVQQDSIPYRTQDGVDMLGATHAYVLGDANSVSNDLMSDLTQSTGSTIRFFGADRYGTAADIAEKIKNHMPGKKLSGVAFVVNGDKWPDALAAAPYAAYAGGTGTTITPILLTKQTYLHPTTSYALGDLGITDVVIVGSSSTVDTAVADQLGGLLGGAQHVLRVGGANRYETSMLLSLWMQDKWGPGVRGDGKIGTQFDSDKLPAIQTRLEDGAPSFAVATGQNYPDALAGGAMCGRLGIPLLLSPKSSMSPYILDPAKTSAPFNDWVRLSNSTTVRHGWLFGGTGTLTEGVEDSLNADVSGQDLGTP